MNNQVEVVVGRGIAAVEGNDNGIYNIHIDAITPDMIDDQGRLIVDSANAHILSQKKIPIVKPVPVIIKKENNEITIKKRLDAIR